MSHILIENVHTFGRESARWSLALVLAAGLLVPRPSLAVTACSVTVNETDGSIKVSANSTGTSLRWGTAAGQENTPFANAGSCISGSSANNCMLGTSGTLAANTAPATCTIYLKDSTSSCSKWLPRCVPGVRLIDSSFASGDPRVVAVSVESGPTLRFSGVNVQVVSGSGATDGTVNGLGNLIVGYNEAGTLSRTGSHNLVLGTENGYTRFGSLVLGEDNHVGENAAAIGGYGNSAGGDFAVAIGGNGNVAGGITDVVCGGLSNTAAGIAATITGGSNNYVTYINSWVGGGESNQATASSSSVAGGTGNVASVEWATVSGGSGNTASGERSSAVGGAGCTVTNADELQAGPDCVVIQE